MKTTIRKSERLSDRLYIQNGRKLTGLILLLAAFAFFMFYSFPDYLKVQFSYPQEEPLSYHTYFVYDDKVELIDSERFFDGNLAIPFLLDKAKPVRAVEVKYEGTELNDVKKLTGVCTALGNYIFYIGNVDESGFYFLNDLEILETGGLRVTGENPYMLFQVPYQLLEENIDAIWLRHILLWGLFAAVVVALYWCYGGAAWKVCGRAAVWLRKNMIALGGLLGCILAGWTVGCILCYCNQEWFYFKELQNSEILLWLSAAGILFWLLYRRTGEWLPAIFATCVISVFMLFSIKGLSTFLTADERAAIQEQAKLVNDELRHWMMQSCWMNYAIMGSFFEVFHWEWTELVTGLDYKQVAKLCHWIFGFLLLLIIGDVVQRRIVSWKRAFGKWQTAGTYILIYAASFLLPVVTISLKSYNYDMFSTLFGALGSIYAFLAFRDKRPADGLKAVIFTTFGMFEKMQVLPMVLVSCTVFTFVMMERKKAWFARLITGMTWALFSVGMLFGLHFTVAHYVLGFLKDGKAPITTFGMLVNDLFVRMSSLNQLGYRFSNSRIGAGLAVGVLLAALFLIAGSVLSLLCHMKSEHAKKWLAAMEKALWAAMLIFTVMGFLFLFMNVEYLDDGNYLIYFCHVIRHYFQAMPTIFLLLLLLVLWQIKNVKERLLLLCSMALVTWGMVPAFLIKMRWNPTWPRYLNLFLYLYCLLILTAAVPILYEKFTCSRLCVSIVSLLAIFHVGETVGSMPGYTYFAPFWYGITTIAKPAEDCEMIVYWGENRASLGQMVADYCEENGMTGEQVNLYYGYIRGDWVTQPEYVEVQPKLWNEEYENCGVTEQDFYILDTQGVKRGMIRDGWPAGVDPLMEVKYRGYVIARIYQGTQLREYFGKV